MALVLSVGLVSSLTAAESTSAKPLAATATSSDDGEALSSRRDLPRPSKRVQANAWTRPRALADSKGSLRWVRPSQIRMAEIHRQAPSFLRSGMKVEPIKLPNAETKVSEVTKASNIEPVPGLDDPFDQRASEIFWNRQSVGPVAAQPPKQNQKAGRRINTQPPVADHRLKHVPPKSTVKFIARDRLPKVADTFEDETLDVFDDVLDDLLPADEFPPEKVPTELDERNETAPHPDENLTDEIGPLPQLIDDSLDEFDRATPFESTTVPSQSGTDLPPIFQPDDPLPEDLPTEPIDELPAESIDDDLLKTLDVSGQDTVEDVFGDDDPVLPDNDDIDLQLPESPEDVQLDDQQADTELPSLPEEVDSPSDLPALSTEEPSAFPADEPTVEPTEDVFPAETGDELPGTIPDVRITPDDVIDQYNGRDCPNEMRVFQKAWEMVRGRSIRDISLDITPSIEPNGSPEEVEEGRQQNMSLAPARTWRDVHGEFLVEGRMQDFRDGKIFVKDEDGQTKSLWYHQLSNDDLCFVSAWWELPTEYSPFKTDYEVRDWTMTTFTWTASADCHKPLYFEDVQLERYGHSAGPIRQPFLSGVHFFGNILFLPYHVGLNPPNECQYALGYYRPGNCAPWLVPAVPLSARGARLQLSTLVAGLVLIP